MKWGVGRMPLGSFGTVLRAGIAALSLAFATSGHAAEVFKLEPALENVKPLGPGAAKGAVIWSHGRSVNSEDSLSPTPYYMHVLQDGGWDAYRFNRLREGDTL